jgi:hypothetical protein
MQTSSVLQNVAWDTTLWQAAVITPQKGRWMVQRLDTEYPSKTTEACYLQIATGRWVTKKHATSFPNRSSAEAYAREYGLDLGAHRCLVRPA